MKIWGRGESCYTASFVSVGEGFIEGVYEMQEDMYACIAG